MADTKRKDHWSKHNWGDWFKDPALDMCRQATKGLWIDAIGRMYSAGSDRVEGGVDRLAHHLRADSTASLLISAFELAETGTADVLINGQPALEWRQANSRIAMSESTIMANGVANLKLTIICRRRTRELEISTLRQEIGSKGGKTRWQTHSKGDGKGIANQNSKGDGKGVSEVHTSGDGKPLVLGSGSGSGSSGGGSEEGGPADVGPSVDPPPDNPPQWDNGQPSDADFLAYCASKKMIAKSARDLLGKLKTRGWRDATDVPVRNWRAYVDRLSDIEGPNGQKPRPSSTPHVPPARRRMIEQGIKTLSAECEQWRLEGNESKVKELEADIRKCQKELND